MKWGIVGAGDIVRKRIISAIRLSSGAELLGITRRDTSALAAFVREFEIPRSYSNLDALLDDGEVEAVYIATPVAFHAEQTIAAAVAGKQVLCEKPMALDAVEADRMIAACTHAGVTLGVAYYRRFYPVIRRIGDLIDDGAIGRVAQARIDAFEPFDPPQDHPRSWLLDATTSGGGPMIDFGCHRIEIFTSLFGTPKDTEVHALRVTSTLRREVEDNAVAILRLGDDVLGTVAVSHSVGIPHDTLTIWGSRGMIHSPVLNEGGLVLTQTDGKGASHTTHEHHAPLDNPHRPLIEEFERAVAEKRAPAVDGADGRLVTTILDKIYRRDA